MAYSPDYLNSSASHYYWPGFLDNVSNTSLLYEQLVGDVKMSMDYQKWVMSIIGCLLVGLSGIFPLLIFPNCREEEEDRIPKMNGDNNGIVHNTIPNSKKPNFGK